MSNTDTASCATSAEGRQTLSSACDRESGQAVVGVEPSREPDQSTAVRVRVFVSAGHRLLREGLIRMLRKRPGMNVQEVDLAVPAQSKILCNGESGILLLGSSGCGVEDLRNIHEVRTCAPKIRILLLASSTDEHEFLQCLRAGVTGYLPEDASSEEVRQAIEVIAAGGSVCPASFCGVLFRNFT